MLVDDHEVVRLGLRALFGQTGEIDVVAEAGNVADAVKRAAQHRPDVVLMDLRLPDGWIGERGLRCGDRSLRGLNGAREARDIRIAVLGLLQITQLGLDFTDLAFEAHQARGILADGALKLIAPCDKVSQRAGEFAVGLFHLAKRSGRRGDARRNFGFALRYAA